MIGRPFTKKLMFDKFKAATNCTGDLKALEAAVRTCEKILERNKLEKQKEQEK